MLERALPFGVVASIACGGSPAVSPDAAPPDARPVSTEILVSVSVRPAEALPDGLAVDLDGMPGHAPVHWEATYPSYAAAVAEPHILELRYGDAVLDEMDLPRCGEACGEGDDSGVIYQLEGNDITAYPNGELRFGSITCQYAYAMGGSGTCVGDGFNLLDCEVVNGGGCSDGHKCALLVTHADPMFSRIACVPDGDVPLGGTCTHGSPGTATGHDDCVEAAACVDSVCRPFCVLGDDCGGGETCTALDWTPPDRGVCLP